MCVCVRSNCVDVCTHACLRAAGAVTLCCECTQPPHSCNGHVHSVHVCATDMDTCRTFRSKGRWFLVCSCAFIAQHCTCMCCGLGGSVLSVAASLYCTAPIPSIRCSYHQGISVAGIVAAIVRAPLRWRVGVSPTLFRARGVERKGGGLLYSSGCPAIFKKWGCWEPVERVVCAQPCLHGGLVAARPCCMALSGC